MRPRKLVVAGAVVAAVLVTVLTGVVGAWDNSTGLKTGDVACSDWVRTDGSVKLTAFLTNGSGEYSIRRATSVGGAETVLWSRQGTNLDVSQTVAAPAPGGVYRACLRVTASAVNTWHKYRFAGVGAGGEGDLGPHTASLSPGGRACGDAETGSVRLTGTANVSVTWSLNGTDAETYSSVGQIFATTGASVDQAFTPGDNIIFQEMCATNTSNTRATVSFEQTPA